MALVRSNNHVKVICPQSNLWNSVLVSLILSFAANFNIKIKSKKASVLKLFGFILNIIVNGDLIGCDERN